MHDSTYADYPDIGMRKEAVTWRVNMATQTDYDGRDVQSLLLRTIDGLLGSKIYRPV